SSAGITLGTGGVGAITIPVAVIGVGYGAGVTTVGSVNLMAASRTPHGDERAEQAQSGDQHRQVGDVNKVIDEGKHFTDTETGNDVYVKGNRVVITDADGNIVTQFKNTKANTIQRIEDGKWVPTEPDPQPEPHP